ncbi:MAG: cation transport ATPase [Glaciihabitans sp.]|nr:cation transport ATPase [Glaciihabitans sp.]
MTTPTHTNSPGRRSSAAAMTSRERRGARRAAATPDRNPLSRGDRAGLWLILVLGCLFGVTQLVLGVVYAVGYGPALAGGPTDVTLVAQGAVPSAGLDGTAALLGGDFTEAKVRVEGLSGLAASLLLARSIVSTLTNLAVVGAVILLTIRLLRGSPFLRSVTFAAIVAAIAAMIGGLAEQAIRGFAQMQVVSELTADFGETSLVMGFTFDPTSFAIGFGLAVVATAFQFAERLQRDTEGLV